MSDFTSCLPLIEEHGFYQLPNFGHKYSIQSPSDLANVLDSWSIEWRGYTLGQSRRSRLARQVYTVSEYNATRTLSTHHELSYTSRAPRWIVFYANQPASEGDITLLDGFATMDALLQSQWAHLLEEGIVYRKCMPSKPRFGFGKTWQEHFEASDNEVGRAEVESHLSQVGWNFKWLDNGDLSVEFVRPMYIRHLSRPCWFAQPRLWSLPFQGIKWFEQSMPSILWPTAVSLKNERCVPMALLQWLTAFESQQAHRVHLKKGALLIIDNHRIAHGRTPYSGQRDHWVAMGDALLDD